MRTTEFGEGSEEFNRIVEQGGFILKAFHEESKKDRKGPHTEFWQREFAGFRDNLRQTYGEPNANLIVDVVCRKTGLELPKPTAI